MLGGEPSSRTLCRVPQLDFLKDLVVILAAAIVVVVVLRRLGVPAIAGFILTGVLIGPTTLELVDDTHQVEVLAEVGVVLLLFGIGLGSLSNASAGSGRRSSSAAAFRSP